MIGVVQVVDDDCHTRGVDESLAPGCYCGIEDVNCAIEIDGFDAFPIFGSCAIARLPSGYDPSGVYDEIRTVADESGFDAFFGSEICVDEGVDVLPEMIIRRTDVKRINRPSWMFFL